MNFPLEVYSPSILTDALLSGMVVYGPCRAIPCSQRCLEIVQSAMMTSGPSSFRTYRCPCCGYRDDIDMRAAESITICTRCDTPLYLRIRSVDDLRLEVVVAHDAPAPANQNLARRSRIH